MLSPARGRRVTSQSIGLAAPRALGVLTVVFITLSLALGAFSLVLNLHGRGPVEPGPLQGMTRQQLEEEKLRQEIRNLESERSLLRLLPSYAAIVTAIGAILGFFGTLRGQRRERRSETLRRFDENFNTVVANLGSERLSVQASAAVSLMTFLRPEYVDLYDQIFLVTLANLKVPYKPEVNRLLVSTFSEVLERLDSTRGRRGAAAELDLARTHLDRVDLTGRNLSGADLGFASMRRAVLRNSDLTRVRGIQVVLEHAILSDANLKEARLDQAHCRGAIFHNARMSPCWLEKADLRETKFQGAKLQSAHLDGADLRAAGFEGADLNDTYFCGANLDDAAIQSIKSADNWQRAHFDDTDKARIQRLTGEAPTGRCGKAQEPARTPATPEEQEGQEGPDIASAEHPSG
jgi:uncharacterized protein YjbI with pentapeptide repeats